MDTCNQLVVNDILAIWSSTLIIGSEMGDVMLFGSTCHTSVRISYRRYSYWLEPHTLDGAKSFFNRTPLRQNVPLNRNDRIRLGDVEMQVADPSMAGDSIAFRMLNPNHAFLNAMGEKFPTLVLLDGALIVGSCRRSHVRLNCLNSDQLEIVSDGGQFYCRSRKLETELTYSLDDYDASSCWEQPVLVPSTLLVFPKPIGSESGALQFR